MTHKDAMAYLKKQFIEVADQDIIIDINESQMIPQKLSFKAMYHLYQAKHLEKYGEYLQIAIPD
jgi:hypothetical protein